MFLSLEKVPVIFWCLFFGDHRSNRIRDVGEVRESEKLFRPSPFSKLGRQHTVPKLY